MDRLTRDRSTPTRRALGSPLMDRISNFSQFVLSLESLSAERHSKPYFNSQFLNTSLLYGKSIIWNCEERRHWLCVCDERRSRTTFPSTWRADHKWTALMAIQLSFSAFSFFIIQVFEWELDCESASTTQEKTYRMRHCSNFNWKHFEWQNRPSIELSGDKNSHIELLSSESQSKQIAIKIISFRNWIELRIEYKLLVVRNVCHVWPLELY